MSKHRFARWLWLSAKVLFIVLVLILLAALFRTQVREAGGTLARVAPPLTAVASRGCAV